MFRETQPLQTIFNAAEAAATGVSIFVQGYRHCVLAFDTSDSANGTVKVQGSISNTCPDFSAAQSPANSWFYIACKDLSDEASIPGATGFVVSGTDGHQLAEVNINQLVWLSATITAQSAGKITLKAKVATD